MKKRDLFLSSALLVGFLTACGGPNPPAGSSTPPPAPSSSAEEEGPKPGDYAYQAPLEAVDVSSLRNELILHYSLEKEGTDRADYAKWRTWMWAEGKDGKEYNPNGIDDFGSIFHYPLADLTGLTDKFAAAKIGFIVKTLGDGAPWAGTVSKDGDADRFIDLSLFTPDENGNYEVYLQSGIATIYDEMPTSRDALGSVYFYDEKGKTRLFVSAIAGKFKKLELLRDGEALETFAPEAPSSGGSFSPSADVSLTAAYQIRATFESEVEIVADVSFYPLFRTASFDEAYTYSGELGAIRAGGKTTFRVWSPMSTSIKLRVYASGTPKSVDANKGSDEILHEIEMEKGEKGVFSAAVDEDLAGKYYTYVVTNAFFQGKEIVDPYARGAGVNGLRGMVVDFRATDPEGWEEVRLAPYDRKELVVYETHVQDVTSSASWQGEEAHRGKYLGLAEAGTVYEKDGKSTPTGFDYLTSLGFNALQIMPFFDQANDELNHEYNWGYNPLNYNVLEGAYSSDPHDGYARIKEFKEVVKAYSSAGINLIMDVVYNHVNSVSGSNFDVLMPGYYFRYVNAGAALSNGSGCGNETASELPMMRRFIVDSASFLAEEYKLGGFRFDLMALEDLGTMDQVAASLKAIDPHIAVYGEPWTGGTSALLSTQAASQQNASKYQGYGQFNDGMRDALIKGGMKGANEIGFATARDDLPAASPELDRAAILAGLAGHTVSSGSVYDADKTTNYVTCHDNYTLGDRFDAAAKANSTAETSYSYREEEKKAMSVLANSFVLSSLGTSFLNAGEEFLRTKGGSHNSYGGDALTEEMIENGFTSWSKVNELDYALALENADMVETYKKMIALKTGDPTFAQASTKEGNPLTLVQADDGLIVVDLQGEGKTLRLAFRNGLSGEKSVDFAGFDLVYASNGDASLSAKTAIRPYQTICAERKAS